MFSRSLFSAGIAIGLVLLAGCRAGKLNVSETVHLDDKTTAHAFTLPAQSKAQTVKIEFSSDKEVSVYVMKESDAPEKDESSPITADPTKAIAKKVGSKGDTLTAEIPANTSSRVIIRFGGGSKTDVKIKITNQ
jgi:hypothetical protein